MAVVYADLRFGRPAPPTQRGDHSPCDDWMIIYENVAPARGRREREAEPQKTSPQVTHQKGFLARYSSCVLVTVCFLTLLAAVTLAILLSRVTHQHHETGTRLERLQQEHGHLNSSLTSNIQSKDSAVHRLQETLLRTQSELEQAQKNLLSIREEREMINATLQSILREKEDREATLERVRTDLRSTQNRLQEKTTEVTSCQSNLNRQKSTHDSEVKRLKNDYSTASDNLKTNALSLAKKETELKDAKGRLQKTERQLQESRLNIEEQKKKWSDLEQRLRGADQCLRENCQEDGEDDRMSSDVVTLCPHDWKQIGDNCYFFSKKKAARIDAVMDCTARSATLAILLSNDSVLLDVISKAGGSFWIGLNKDGNVWKWPDGTTQVDFKPIKYCMCVRAQPDLDCAPCSYYLPWICQKKARRCSLKMRDLRCIGEKTGLFGEKIWNDA